MLIDRSHLGWAVATAAVTLGTGAHYSVYARRSLNGPTGGSWEGLGYGAATWIIILLAAMLPLRRRVVSWRLGSARAWLRAHIWTGLLSVPMLWWHSGFHWGIGLTFTLSVFFYLVIFSGVLGLVFQQVLPGRMTAQISFETVYEEIDRILDEMALECRMRVEKVCGPIPTVWEGAPYSVAGAAALDGSRPMLDFYMRHVAPFMDGLPSFLAQDPERGTAPFDQLRTLVPLALHETVDHLDLICEERRQLLYQKRLHHILHGWLYVHVPLSMALVVLMTVHAVMSLKYI